MQSDFPFDQSGIFEIHVLGKLDQDWVECTTGMACAEQRCDETGEWVTILLGRLPDQAALNGIINALYLRQLAIRYLAMVESDTPAGPPTTVAG